MREGMASIMGLCPPPEEWMITDWTKPFGRLPSDLKSEDWEWLIIDRDKEFLRQTYEMWNRMVANPDLKISMPSDVIDYMMKLMGEAEEWQKKRSA